MKTPSLPLPSTAAIGHWIAVELADLSLEIFATSYGADWAMADRLAEEQIGALLDYAATWDALAFADGNQSAECPF